MHSRLFAHRPPLSVWARLAAFLGFLAVLSALVAPVSMLADEVRTGQLSAVCHFSPAPNSDADSRAGDGPSAGAHCDLCGALGWALPPLGAAPIACFAGCQVAAVDFSAVVAVATLGLPFSRGPSALLS